MYCKLIVTILTHFFSWRRNKKHLTRGERKKNESRKKKFLYYKETTDIVDMINHYFNLNYYWQCFILFFFTK